MEKAGFEFVVGVCGGMCEGGGEDMVCYVSWGVVGE